jgi:hypothetical protein
MKVIRHTDPDFSERLRELGEPSSLFDEMIERRARAILDEVQELGDEAVLKFTERFDGAKLSAEQLLRWRPTPRCARPWRKRRRTSRHLPGNPGEKAGPCATRMGRLWAKNSTHSSGLASIFPAARLRWFRRR